MQHSIQEDEAKPGLLLAPVSCRLPSGIGGFVHKQTLTGTLGSWIVMPPPHTLRRYQQTAMLLPWGYSRQSELLHVSTWYIACLQGLCWERVGWRCTIRIEGKGERGEKRETVSKVLCPAGAWLLPPTMLPTGLP